VGAPGMFEISDDTITAGGQVDDTAAIFHIINQHGKPLGDQLRDGGLQWVQ